MVFGDDPTVYYRDIVNSIQEALVVLDSKLTIQYANLPFYKLLGGREETTLGKSFLEVGAVLTEDPAIKSLLSAVLPHGVVINDFTIEQTFPIIGRRILNLSAKELARVGGSKADQMIVTLSDVTDEEIEAEEKDETIQKTNAMMTEVNHRVKNNLASILSMIRIEARMIEGADGKDALERIAMRVESMASLYELLAINENTGTIALLTYINSICGSIERLSSAPQMGWSVSVSGDDPTVNVDEAIAIGAIVNELVANAAKYAFRGRQDIGKIAVRCERRMGHLTVEVADNGCGIDEADSIPKSTGLGMKLVGLYLANLNGTMDRQSGESGTSCRMTIPMASTDTRERAAPGNLAPEPKDDASADVVTLVPKASA